MAHHSTTQKRKAGRFASDKPRTFATDRVNTVVIGAAHEGGGFRGIADGEEWNPELVGTNGYKTMDRMYASDPTVSAVIRAH